MRLAQPIAAWHVRECEPTFIVYIFWVGLTLLLPLVRFHVHALVGSAGKAQNFLLIESVRWHNWPEANGGIGECAAGCCAAPSLPHPRLPPTMVKSCSILAHVGPMPVLCQPHAAAACCLAYLSRTRGVGSHRSRTFLGPFVLFCFGLGCCCGLWWAVAVVGYGLLGERGGC
jgi:hypothetical protein